MEDDFSIFHTGNFLPFPFLFRTKNLPFHIPFHTNIFFHIPFHTSIPSKFRPEDARNLYRYCIFATLSVPLHVVARQGKQYGTMHFIPYSKNYSNELS